MRTRCSACPGHNPDTPCTMVMDCGPMPCDVLLLGTGPGKVENKTGVPYTGLAGDELTGLYLPLAGVDREAVHISNVTLCWDGTDRTPPDKRIQACARTHLPELIGNVQPSVIVLMGAGACSIVDGGKVRLDLHHGRPLYASLLDGEWQGWIWASYEPALGMRDTGQMEQLMKDFQHFGWWLKGQWQPPRRDVAEVHHYTLLSGELAGLHPVIALDRESHANRPWSLQWSGVPGTGYMIKTDDRRAVGKLAAWIKEEQPQLIFHNAGARVKGEPSDLDVLEQLGIYISPEYFHTRCRDTMQEAFHLCDQPQGLKQLVYRLFGTEMRAWEDVVWPASINAITKWLYDVCSVAIDDLADVRRKKTKKVLYEVRQSPVALIAGHIIKQMAKPRTTEQEQYDPWDALKRMRIEGLRGAKAEDWEWEFVEQKCGRAPLLGIDNCDQREAVLYAVGDADWTLRAAAELAMMRGERWHVEQEDWDQ